MDAHNKAFSYKPLRTNPSAAEIRLIKLLPSTSFSEKVECKIYNTSLNVGPIYNALSYTWGDATITRPIILQGHQYQVTANLEMALRHLRLEHEERILWVDAICINQKDIQEKNSQVRIMRRIYTSTKEVFVWLGEEVDAKLALDFLWNADALHEDEHENNKFTVADANHSKINSRKWAACKRLFERSWWSRTWVIQEVITDKPVTVCIGSHRLSLDDLCKLHETYRWELGAETAAISFLQSSNEEEDLIDLGLPVFTDQGIRAIQGSNKFRTSFFQSVYNLFEVMKSENSIPAVLLEYRACVKGKTFSRLDFSLPALLKQFRGQQASDHRDKVYAFLGLAMDSKDNMISINYNLPKRLIYMQLSTYLATSYGCGTCLLSVDSTHNNNHFNERLPSWVADWSQTPLTLTQTINEQQKKFSADKGLIFAGHPLSISPHLETLQLKGRYIGKVTEVNQVYTNPVSQPLSRTALFRYCRVFSKTNPSRILTGPVNLPKMDFPNACWGACKTEVGDYIVAVASCSVPIILRAVEEFFLYVGSCWLIDAPLQKLPDDVEFYQDPGFSPFMFGRGWEPGEQILGLENFVLR